MLSIKRKLRSQRGASMLLAMVFLMFCLFIGGSVLAAATANGSRVEHLKNDQQDYLSQRSAMLLMAELLVSKDGKELQVMITDVTKVTTPADGSEATSDRTVTISCPTLLTNEEPTIFHQMLFGIVAKKYTSAAPLPEGKAVTFAANLKSPSIPSGNFETARKGTVSVTLTPDGADAVDPLSLAYEFNPVDLTLTVTGTSSSIRLVMDGSIGEGNENTVTVGNTTTTTKTTVVRWSKPVIEKGEVAPTEGGAST